MNNDEQLEAEAVNLIRNYTEDVYIGPDIKSECVEAMVKRHGDEMVYLQPVVGSDRRVIAALLRDADTMAEASRYILPYGYVIGQCISNNSGEVAVKWFQINTGKRVNFNI